jgi:hypothetical protein
MSKDPKELMAMSDEDLVFYTLSGDVDSYAHRIGETAVTLRASLRMLEASKEQAAASQDMLASTREALRANRDLVRYTRMLAVSSWAVVVITLLTQGALICMTALSR